MKTGFDRRLNWMGPNERSYQGGSVEPPVRDASGYGQLDAIGNKQASGWGERVSAAEETYLADEPAAGRNGRECGEHDCWNGGGISIAAAKQRQALERLGVWNAVVLSGSGAGGQLVVRSLNEN